MTKRVLKATEEQNSSNYMEEKNHSKKIELIKANQLLEFKCEDYQTQLAWNEKKIQNLEAKVNNLEQQKRDLQLHEKSWRLKPNWVKKGWRWN